MEYRFAVVVGAENAIGHQYMKVDVAVEITAETVDESHGAPMLYHCLWLLIKGVRFQG